MNEANANVDVDVDDTIDAAGDAYARWAARPPPDLSKLPSAVSTAGGLRVLIADTGDVVIYNVYATVLPGRPYLRTVKGRIVSVDAPRGIAWVFDVDRQHRAVLDFGSSRTPWDEVRFPAGSLKERHEQLIAEAAEAIERGDLDEAIRCRNASVRMLGRIQVAEEETSGKRRVGRPRKVRSAAELTAIAERDARRAKGEVHRGRPKGTKNRPKEVIEAEKALRMKERRDKKAGKKARK